VNLNIHRYHSIGAFCDFIVNGGVWIHRQSGNDSDLYGGWTTSRALSEMRSLGGASVDWARLNGWIDEAGKRVDATFDRPKREWVEAPMGAYPIIPDVLRGYPMPMRHMSAVGLEQSPMRIVIDCASSWSVNGDLIFKRGIYIAALVLRLMETRPVQVEAAYGVQVDGALPFLANQMILVAMDPADLMREVAYMSGGNCFTRHMGPLAAVVHTRADINCNLFWLWKNERHGEQQDELYAQRIRKAMHLDHGDLYVPPANYWDIQQLEADPGAWLRQAMNAQE
jgi:hypothetical protein